MLLRYELGSRNKIFLCGKIYHDTNDCIKFQIVMKVLKA